jgi:ABC-2 type transport system ATP-binding protein
MIEAQHLSKRYRKKLAVDNLTFTVEPGKVTGFLGPNGAGKSTTMRLMLGLDTGQGETLYDGKPLQAYTNPAQLVGILLEAKAFHPTRTARNHLRVLAAQAGVPDKRVDEAINLVGLQEVAGKRAGKFSLGMSQRLGVAAAILSRPKYLLLDEPANGLDPEGIAWLRKFIRQYAGAGNGVLVSSHLLSEMSQMADNVVVIGKGKLITSTTMRKLLSGSTHSRVFVRAEQLPRLQNALRQHKFEYETSGNGLLVSGAATDDVGKLAYVARVPLLELTAHSASLEDVFLELTADAEEFTPRARQGDAS